MAKQITTYVIDACGLIAYFRDEGGADKLRELFKISENRFFLHSVNLGEIYYDSLRVSGSEQADEVLKDIDTLPIDVIWTLDLAFLKLVGKYKTSYKISYADCFVALAKRENGTVITTDHGEFDPIEDSDDLTFYWLR